MRYLRPAIESALAQTFMDWQMIIADDGSTEETRAQLRSITDPRIRTIWLPHSGNPSVVRNAGIRASTGRYLAFLDSDDVWAPSKLEKQLATLRDRPDRRWSYTHCDRIDENGNPLVNDLLRRHVPLDGWIVEPLLKLEAQIAMPTVIADRELVVEVGGFDENQRFCEDYDLYLRLAMRSAVAALVEPLCSIRAHSEHHSGDRIGEYEGWVRLCGKMANLLPDPRLRALSRRIRAERSLTLAGFEGDKGDVVALLRTLARASVFSWRYPDWWLGALKAVARPLMPKTALSAYRQARAQRSR